MNLMQIHDKNYDKILADYDEIKELKMQIDAEIKRLNILEELIFKIELLKNQLEKNKKNISEDK